MKPIASAEFTSNFCAMGFHVPKSVDLSDHSFFLNEVTSKVKTWLIQQAELIKCAVGLFHMCNKLGSPPAFLTFLKYVKAKFKITKTKLVEKMGSYFNLSSVRHSLNSKPQGQRSETIGYE